MTSITIGDKQYTFSSYDDIDFWATRSTSNTDNAYFQDLIIAARELLKVLSQ